MPLEKIKTIITVLLTALVSTAFGQSYLHGQGGRLYDATNQLVRLGGVNWFGFETSNLSPHGLWARDYHGALIQIKNLGFNCIRLPFCNAMFRDSAKAASLNFYGTDPMYPRAQTDFNKELQGKTPIEIMDEIIRYAGQIGLSIILDDHSREPDKYMEEKLWYTAKTSEKQWVDDWVMLATRYKNNPTVIGCDLDNEPHGKPTDGGSVWGTGDTTVDWNLAAQKCGNAILSVNPDVLIVIEGVEQVGTKTYWWGGNLAGVATTPIVLSKPEKLVYSPHEYGPEVFQQTWFDSPSFPSNVEAVWDSAFGYISKTNKAPLLVGEFGIKDTASFGGKSGVWFKAFIKYMAEQCISWTFWCFNPNSGDTGGLLSYDWITVEQWKVDALKTYWSIPVYTDHLVPTALTLTPATVAENIPAGAPVGGFSTVDADSGERFTYTLVSGTGADDNALFQISDSLLKTAQLLKCSGKPTRSIRVQVTDRGGLSFQKAFTIQITSNNHAPSNVSLGNASVNEHCALSTVVGELSAIDPDGGDSLAFSLVTGIGSSGNAGFTIDKTTLKTALTLDHQTTPVCSLRVSATDNGSPAMSIEKVFIITVKDINEPPVIVSYTPVKDTIILPLDTTIVFTAVPKDPETLVDSLATGWFIDTSRSVMPLKLSTEGFHKLTYFVWDGQADTVKHTWILDVRNFLTTMARGRAVSALPSDLSLTVGMGRAGKPLKLRFGIPRELAGKPMVIAVHNFRGQSIYTFSQSQAKAGWFSSEMGTASMGSGIYTCTIRVGERVKRSSVIVSR